MENKFIFLREKSEKCKKCPWKSYCQGGCTCRVLTKQCGGTDNTECVINNTVYPLLIELILTKPRVVNVLTGLEIM